MKYAVADCIAEYGFSFFENLHEPIFLIDDLGRTLKVNKAGRKFLCVAHQTARGFDDFIKSVIAAFRNNAEESVIRTNIGKGLHLVARKFARSNLILIEILK
ncbi:MAG: hypothetical protein C5B49_14985 [Bdellovibrio sp.]|nr:MAG: hypothetical protein C5B49_14985 [Bdellovibrio sp.]